MGGMFRQTSVTSGVLGRHTISARDEPHHHQQCHDGEPQRHHALWNGHRYLRRLAALVELPELPDDRYSAHHDHDGDDDEGQLAQQGEHLLRLGGHHAHHHVHAELATRPGNHAVAEEDTAHHEVEHHLFGPKNRIV